MRVLKYCLVDPLGANGIKVRLLLYWIDNVRIIDCLQDLERKKLYHTFAVQKRGSLRASL